MQSRLAVCSRHIWQKYAPVNNLPPAFPSSWKTKVTKQTKHAFLQGIAVGLRGQFKDSALPPFLTFSITKSSSFPP
eukprot:1147540-Pelagomonas_calceolata.AAC.4